MTDSLTVNSGETDILVRLGRDETVTLDDGGTDLAVHGFGSEHVIQIEGKGPQGSKGEEGDITPELQALHEDTIAAKDRAVTAEDTAEGAAADALLHKQGASSAKTGAEIAYQSTITERQDAVAARQGAETAETNAAAHATTSGQNKTASAASAAAALTSEQNAKTSEDNAAEHVTTVVTAKDEAVAANAATQTAKTDAQTAATNAGTSETNAEAANTAAQTAKTDTIAARDVTTAAKDETVLARNATVAARDVTTAARDETVLAKTAAQTAATGAATSETNAVAANSAAQTAKVDTQVARDTTIAAHDATLLARDETAGLKTDTITAAGTASTARDETVAARDVTVAARDVTVAAKDRAITAETTATTAASGAETSEQNTLTHRQAAEAAATNAIASESTATSKATEATNAATTAAGARDDTQALLEAFRSAHLGISSADPTTDLNGDPLTGGETYVSSSSGMLRYYNGSIWQDILLSETEMDTKIQAAVDSLLAGAPDALDTLNELALALQDNDSDIATILDQIATKADIGHVHGWTEITDKPTTFTPSAHNHSFGDLTGMIGDAQLPNYLQGSAATISDWNDATANGWFMGSSAANAPEGSSAWHLGHVEKHNGVWITQTIHRFTADSESDTQIWRRSCEAGTWQPWYKLQWSQVEQDARYALKSHGHSWGEISGKPTTFTPNAHNHDAGDLTGTISDDRLPSTMSSKIFDTFAQAKNFFAKPFDASSNPNLHFHRFDDTAAFSIYWNYADDTTQFHVRNAAGVQTSSLFFDNTTGHATYTGDFTFNGVSTFVGSDKTGTSNGALEVSYNSTVTGQGSNKTHLGYNGTHNYLRGERTIIDTPRTDVQAIYGNGVGLTNVNAALLDGHNGSYYAPASEVGGSFLTNTITARHVNGKIVGGTDDDHLYLNHQNGKNVYINANLAWHAGNFDPGSKLNAGAQAADSAKLQGATKEENTDTPNTIVQRNGSGDIWARLLRSTYGSTNANIGAIMTQVSIGGSGDNYVRPSTPAQLGAALSGLVNAATLDGLNSSSFLRSNANDTIYGTLIVPDSNRNGGIVGTYDADKIQQIWAMGTSYCSTADGSTFGNLYGLAYKHTNNPTGGSMAGGHQMVWVDNGVGRCALGSNIWTSGNVTAYSDIRVKTNIERIPDALAKICQLGGYVYDRTDTGERQTGVIAQEVLAVLPEAVTGDEDAYSVAYGNMVGLLIEGIKDLKQENDDLRAEMGAMKSDIEMLKAAIAA